MPRGCSGSIHSASKGRSGNEDSASAGAAFCGVFEMGRLCRGWALGQRTSAAAGSLRACDTAAFALRDKMTPLLDLAQDAVALHSLPETRQQVFARLTVS
jgi:hypothetical protein